MSNFTTPRESVNRGAETHRTASDEQGVALLMTLGVLSLLMVLGLSFALSAMNSLKSVRIAKDLVKARLYDESGFEKIFELLEKEFADLENPDNLFPATKRNVPQRMGPCSWDERYFWVSIFDDEDQDQDFADLNDALYMTMVGVPMTHDSTMENHIATNLTSHSWIHSTDAVDGTKINARVTYIIYDETGKVDPNGICGTVMEGQELRTGGSPDEISLIDVLEDTPLAQALQSSDVDPANGLRDPDSMWFSYYDIFKTFHKQDTEYWENFPDNADNIMKNIFPFSYDIEAFSVIEEDTGQPIDKHRFNLGREDWDTIENDTMVATILSNAADFWAGGNTGGIQWLMNASDSTPKEQIAANIVDYCDIDDGEPVNATTDYNISSPTGRPSYCGNEQVPYINEIQFKVGMNLTGFTFAVHRIELINMYDYDVATSFADATLTVTVVVDSSEVSDLDLTFVRNITAADGVTLDAPDYIYFNDINPVETLPNIPQETMTSLAITVKSVKLTDTTTGLLMDFAFDEDSTSGGDTIVGTGGLMERYVSVECNDPRNNLDADEWTWDSWGDGPGDSGSVIQVGSPRTPNTVFSIGADASQNDQEPGAVNPWDVSTAFIRNGPMKHFWELGLIHRGQSWQTINLHDYQPVDLAESADMGMGNYAGSNGGDANILSQVKLTSDTEVTGRININTPNANVLKALFHGIRLGSDFSDPTPASGVGINYNNLLADNSATDIIGTTGPVYTGSSAVAPADGTIRAENGSGVNGSGEPLNDPFRYRGEVARVDRLKNGTIGTQNTDRLQEEIIAKVANLITIRQNYFTVMITSQIIDDLLTGYKGGQQGVYDAGIDQVLAEQRLIAILYRDATNNKFDVVRYEYLDE